MTHHEIPLIISQANTIVTDHVVEQMRIDITKPDGQSKVLGWLSWLLHPNKPSKEYAEEVIKRLKT